MAQTVAQCRDSTYFGQEQFWHRYTDEAYSRTSARVAGKEEGEKEKRNEKHEKFFVSEIIREKILRYYDKEIPYSVEVVVERFKEDDKKIHINAIIYVERDSQKGIIIGHQGVALKKVSSEARKALEKFFDKTIFLEVFVKVDKDWRSSQRELTNFGYNPD